MKIIRGSGIRKPTEYFVVDLSEPTKIEFGIQVEDVLISSPDIEILFGFDYARDEDFTKDNAMLLKPFDNLKEFGKERCTTLFLMPRSGNGIVYVTVER